jgi:hypothetical protein
MRRAAAVLALLPLAARAQTGSFVATLGRDTMHLERFTRRGTVLEGTVVSRVPQTRVLKYQMSYDADGNVTRYEMHTTDAAGNAIRTNGAAGSLAYDGDTIVRRTIDKGEDTEQRIPAPRGAFPSPGLPYIGVSYLMYEQAFAATRRTLSSTGDTSIYLLTMLAGQRQPQRARVWLVGADSAELDYFGVARSGYKFDDAGRLIRADWRGTTYRYVVSRGADIDIDAYIKRWADDDKRGVGVGALSPRDTTRATVGDASIVIEYSRPAQRGRNVWGDVVQPEKVWRLGADMATHFSTSTDLTFDGIRVPAGRYTLWMAMDRDGTSSLIVNKRVNIFGTNYDPREDLLRIPLKRTTLSSPVERLTLDIAGGALRISWGDAAWVTPIARSGTG